MLIVAIGIMLMWIARYIRKCIYPRVKGEPPGWVFSIVWTILFIILFYTGNRIWLVRDEHGYSVGRRVSFILLISMLVLWTYTQWYWCRPDIGMLIILIALLLSIGLCVVMIHKEIIVSLLLIPLILWLGYASVLNWRNI